MDFFWLQSNVPDSETPKRTNCRMARDLPASPNRRWYVFEADFGGQILATIPVELVPSWVSRRRLRRALRTMNGWSGNETDHMSVYVVEDFQVYPVYVPFETDPEGYHFYMEMVHSWIDRRVTRIPLGLAFATVTTEPMDEPTRLANWQFCGWVNGGMGGGRLLNNDAWFHYEILYRGLPLVNEVRRLLGLPKLDTLDVQMNDGDREHMEIIVAVLG